MSHVTVVFSDKESVHVHNSVGTDRVHCYGNNIIMIHESSGRYCLNAHSYFMLKVAFDVKSKNYCDRRHLLALLLCNVPYLSLHTSTHANKVQLTCTSIVTRLPVISIHLLTNCSCYYFIYLSMHSEGHKHVTDVKLDCTVIVL